jgi:hypothetical protein
MQIETVGNYQLHLVAHELPDGRWDPFVAVFEFDNAAQDFKCIQEKQRAGNEPSPSYSEAIEIARRVGNALLPSRKS